MISKKLTRILISVAVCLLVGFLSGYATQTSVGTWYATINKPSFNPPNWIFAPVWTVLYVMMGIAAGIVWARGFYHKWVQTALYHFGFQLIFNAMWSIVFFGFQKPFWALLIIITLLILILLTIKWFKVVNKVAAYLLIPYLLWVCFATVLNFSIWQLN
ncbi:tryptophan-rich sensory protein [Galbibacter sp. BG1]|uniref:TspO/MBR family protein n=1 Tax=Galbibacter sp. BG1 TaxID=1170699 RepID=UPI0015B98B87|nr:TspO/MBR family protein [Galbibacter sp. BG1]QLE00808.1 tryptophan-rich sensory protein [Galbibacter sp. BG1]